MKPGHYAAILGLAAILSCKPPGPLIAGSHDSIYPCKVKVGWNHFDEEIHIAANYEIECGLLEGLPGVDHCYQIFEKFNCECRIGSLSNRDLIIDDIKIAIGQQCPLREGRE